MGAALLEIRQKKKRMIRRSRHRCPEASERLTPYFVEFGINLSSCDSTTVFTYRRRGRRRFVVVRTKISVCLEVPDRPLNARRSEFMMLFQACREYAVGSRVGSLLHSALLTSGDFAPRQISSQKESRLMIISGPFHQMMSIKGPGRLK